MYEWEKQAKKPLPSHKLDSLWLKKGNLKKKDERFSGLVTTFASRAVATRRQIRVGVPLSPFCDDGDQSGLVKRETAGCGAEG